MEALKNKKVRSIFLFFNAILLANCIGRATPPEQVKLTQQQNEVLGKFARQVGADEINILLHDPDATGLPFHVHTAPPAPVGHAAHLPGLPAGDLLYILANVNEDRLIRLIKGIGAETTLELILAIKRVGCTRANLYRPMLTPNFDVTVPLNTPDSGLNDCTYREFHLPNIMVQLLNGINDHGLSILIDAVKHSYTNLTCASSGGNLAPEQALCPAGTMITTQPATTATADTFVSGQPYKVAVDHYKFLMKLAYIVAGFDYPAFTLGTDKNFSAPNLPGPAKLYNLMNLTTDARDMVFLLDSFDRETCPGTGPGNCVHVDALNQITIAAFSTGDLWTDIQGSQQFIGLRNLLSVLDLVTDTSKMGILVNGKRPVNGRYNTSYDSDQIRYYIDRLRVVIEQRTACNVGSYTGTPAERALQDFTVPQGGVVAWNRKIATLINLISLANIDRMMDLIYNIDDGFDIVHFAASPCPNRGIDNLMVMLNNLNDVDPHVNDLATYNPPYTNLTANTTNSELITVAWLIENVNLDPMNNNPAKRNRVKYLVENIGNTLDVLQLACYSAIIDNNPTPSGTCANRGLINQVADGSKLDDASQVDLTAAGQKMAALLNYSPAPFEQGIADIEKMRFLIKNVSMANLNGMIKGMLISGTQKTANVVNQITGNNCWNEFQGIIGVLDGSTGLPINPASGIGSGYTSAPTVTFSGGGAGATARAIIETDASQPGYQTIKDVIILTGGNTYVGGNVTFAGGGGIPPGMNPTNIVGNCNFTPPATYRGFPSAAGSGALGMGKLVNMINYVTGSPKSLTDLINGVTDGNKLGLLINGVRRSSNLVGVMNAVLDANRLNTAVKQDLIDLINNLSREDILKMVHLLENLGDAREVDASLTVPSGDHDLIAQLMAPYSAAAIQTTSGLGVAAMTDLVSTLKYSGGANLAAGNLVVNHASGNTAGVAASGAAASFSTTDTGVISAIELTGYGVGCVAPPTVSITGTGTGATAVAILDSGAQQISRISVTNGGSGYTGVPLASFSGGCATQPIAAVRIDRVGQVNITNVGQNYERNPSCTAGGLPVKCVVSGSLSAAGLGNFYGGSGYTTGDVCPITGAGGNSATCTVIAAGGVLTGCSAVSAGDNYSVDRIVKIGGRAEGVVTVVAGAVTAITITNRGCGYSVIPNIEVVGCTTAPTFTVTIPGGQVNASVLTGGAGCPVGAKVVIGENPYVSYADGASAIVNTLQTDTGKLTFVSVSEPTVNAAQLLQLVDRDTTGITSAARGFSVTYNGASPAPADGGISTREALVRLIHHGVTPSLLSSKSYFNGSLGVAGPAGGVAGNYVRDWPGVGPRYLANNILNNLSGVTATKSLIDMVNANTIDLVDTVILLGCGDRVTYSNGWAAFSWQQLCTELGPGVW
ncbi:MAG: hypothetical protein LDLANPLL_00906 [Turneriella sp.]|nr:hypothetical protein [Turneriella sp.]